MFEIGLADTGDTGAILRNFEPGGGDHAHQHPHRGSDGMMYGEPHSHSHDHAHDRDAASDGGHDGFGRAWRTGTRRSSLRRRRGWT